VSLGPGYRQYLRDDHVMFDTSAALSWRLYKMGQARVEFLDLARDRLTLGVQGMWQDQTQVNFFGIGPDVAEDDQTQYRMQSFDLVGYGTYRATDWLAFDGTFGWLPSPKVMPAGGTFQGDFPDTLVVFPTLPAASVSDQPPFLHGMLAVRADTRDHPGHPTRGWYYRAALTNYTDWTTEDFSFNQWEAEGTQFVPLADRRWVLGFRGWIVSAEPLSGNEVPFYLLPSVGGHNTLRDFHTMQFHDNAALVVNAESRWSIFTHMDGAIFFDAGNVAPTVDDLNLDKVSYGAGVRVHIERTTIARFDVAGGPEGWRVVVRTNDPLRLTRYKRRIAAIPFIP
jgi:hypothetical protein